MSLSAIGKLSWPERFIEMRARVITYRGEEQEDIAQGLCLAQDIMDYVAERPHEELDPELRFLDGNDIY